MQMIQGAEEDFVRAVSGSCQTLEGPVPGAPCIEEQHREEGLTPLSVSREHGPLLMFRVGPELYNAISPPFP